MARSYRKHPCIGCNNESNKKDRKIANRKMRHANKLLIRNNMSYKKEFYPEIPGLLDYDYNELWCDWWEEYPIEQLSPSDFKILREARDTWEFSSDGLRRYQGLHQPIKDWSIPRVSYHYKDWKNHPTTTLAEAIRNHNFVTYQHYRNK